MAGIKGYSKNKVGDISKCSIPSFTYKRVPETLPFIEKYWEPVTPGIFRSREEVDTVVIGLKVNPFKDAEPLVANTFTSPEDPVPTIAEMVLLLIIVKDSASVPPNLTDVTLFKLFPFIITFVLGEPDVGEKERISTSVFTSELGVLFWQEEKRIKTKKTLKKNE